MIIPQWPAPDNVKALATEREVFVAPEYQNPLGQSLSPYSAFNLGDHVDDLPSRVASNRQQSPPRRILLNVLVPPNSC